MRKYYFFLLCFVYFDVHLTNGMDVSVRDRLNYIAGHLPRTEILNWQNQLPNYLDQLSNENLNQSDITFIANQIEQVAKQWNDARDIILSQIYNNPAVKWPGSVKAEAEIFRGIKEIIRKLLSKGASIDLANLLADSIEKENPKMVKFLIKQGAKIKQDKLNDLIYKKIRSFLDFQHDETHA